MYRGQIGVVSTETRPFRVTWEIADFFSLPADVDVRYSSPSFYFLDVHWTFLIYPNGNSAHNRGWIGLFLRRNDQGLPKSVRYTLGVKKVGGAEENIFAIKGYTCTGTQYWGTYNFLRRSELAPSGALTIVCSLWYDETHPVNGIRIVSRETQTEDLTGSGAAKEEGDAHLDTKDTRIFSRETQTEDLTGGNAAKEEGHAHLDTKGGDILRKHFQNLLLDGKDHDVTLKVKDQPFRAHKNILGARSPVFAAMFAHNMTENESGDVCIDDCEPNAFGEFLNYVYVGKVENMSPTIATGLYYVADKYDFPDLKETCVEFLKSSLTANVLCDVITLAMKHGEDQLLALSMEYFSQHVVETLMTVEWQRFLTTNPILANELTIKSLKTSSKYTE